jgi:hypothetical protein
MRTLRLPLAALAGATVMFAWSSFSHTTLIRGIGFTPLPNEDALVAQLHQSIRESGLYFFPGIEWNAKPTPDQSAAWDTKFRSGNGLLIFRPSSGGPVSARKLSLQFLGDLLASFFAAYLVSWLPRSFWRRTAALGLMGAFGCVGVSALFWNWYGFTDAFFAAHCLDKIVGWLLVGAAIAKLAGVASEPAPTEKT